MTTKQQIIIALLPIQGKTFDSREHLDDAILPLFGPLQSIFTGESYRDLADKLFDARWIVQQGPLFIVQLPPTPAVNPVTKTKLEDPHVDVDLAILKLLAANPGGLPLESKSAKELADKGLIVEMGSHAIEATTTYALSLKGQSLVERLLTFELSLQSES